MMRVLKARRDLKVCTGSRNVSVQRKSVYEHVFMYIGKGVCVCVCVCTKENIKSKYPVCA